MPNIKQGVINFEDTTERREDMAKSFAAWCEETEAMRNMEWQIIDDKLKQGVNGVEWVVLNIQTNECHERGLEDWIFALKAYGHMNAEGVMRDALAMDPESFYDKYEFNWWIAIRCTFTYLHMMKQRNYDKYLAFLQAMEKKGEKI